MRYERLIGSNFFTSISQVYIEYMNFDIFSASALDVLRMRIEK